MLVEVEVEVILQGQSETIGGSLMGRKSEWRSILLIQGYDGYF